MGSSMTFQIKRIIETFSTERTQVSFGIAVAFHVSIQQPLQGEDFGAESTLKFGGIRFWSGWRQFFLFAIWISGHWIFDAMATIDQFDWCIRWDAKLKK